MSKSVFERKTEREGEVRCEFQVWCQIMCLSGSLCVQLSSSFVRADSLASLLFCATLRTLSTHRFIPTQAQVKATKLRMYLFIVRATVRRFKKQYTIDSFLERLIYQGRTTWPRSS